MPSRAARGFESHFPGNGAMVGQGEQSGAVSIGA
jgi:hypothetical protein